MKNINFELSKKIESERWITAVAVTQNKKAIAGLSDGTINIWDIESGELVKTIKGHKDFIRDITLTPNGDKFITVGDDQTTRTWDLESGEQLQVWGGHTGAVNSVVLTPGGDKIVTASDDEYIKVWTPDGKLLNTLRGHRERIYSVAIMSDGQTIISGAGDATVGVWNINEQEEIKTLRKGYKWISAVAAISDNLIAAGDDSGFIKLWNTETGELIRIIGRDTHSAWITSIVARGEVLYTSSWDGRVKIWNVKSGELLQTLDVHWTVVRDMDVSLDGKLLVTGDDYELKIWEKEEEQ